MGTNPTQLLGQLASQGLMGILLVLSILANAYFIKKIQDVNDKRVQDAQDFSNKLLEPVNAIKANSEILIALFTKFLNSTLGAK